MSLMNRYTNIFHIRQISQLYSSICFEDDYERVHALTGGLLLFRWPFDPLTQTDVSFDSGVMG